MSAEAPRESHRRPRLLSPYEQYQLYQRSEPVALGETPQTANDIIAAAKEVRIMIDQQGFPQTVQPGAALCHSYLPFVLRAGMLEKKAAATHTLLALSRQVMKQARHTFHLDDRTLLVGLMAESTFAAAFCDPKYPTDTQISRTAVRDDMVAKTDFLVTKTTSYGVMSLGRVDVRAKKGTRSVQAVENALGVLEVHVPLFLHRDRQPRDDTPIFDFPPAASTIHAIQGKVSGYLTQIGNNYRFGGIPTEW